MHVKSCDVTSSRHFSRARVSSTPTRVFESCCLIDQTKEDTQAAQLCVPRECSKRWHARPPQPGSFLLFSYTSQMSPSQPSTSQYYFVLQSLHKTTFQYYCILQLAQSTSQSYFVMQGLHEVLPSTTLSYKACTKYFPWRSAQNGYTNCSHLQLRKLDLDAKAEKRRF